MLKAVILDLDGTVYLGSDEVPGASRFIAFLAQKGIRSLFVTNRANRSPEAVCQHLREYGIPCEPSDVLTSAQATAQFLKSGSFYAIGEDALREALEAQGLVHDDQRPDYVVVGFDRGFSYGKLKQACTLIGQGARFIATNPDRGLKLEDGISPGTGAIVAAVSAGSGVEPIVIGKPERRILDMALERMGVSREEAIAVGDNVRTDVPAGVRAGIRTAFILTGISTEADLADVEERPEWIVRDYAELTQLVLDEIEGRPSVFRSRTPVGPRGMGPDGASFWIENLGLQAHPEGGFYREVYRSGESIPRSALPARFPGDRVFATAIHFLLPSGGFSAFHRIRADEQWHYQAGGGLHIHMLGPGGEYRVERLGPDPREGDRLCVVVPAGVWFAAEPVAGAAFSLVSCVVAPGFEFDDFELARRAALAASFPRYEDVVRRLTRA
jgi:4-nitrophenyl phosphatase